MYIAVYMYNMIYYYCLYLCIYTSIHFSISECLYLFLSVSILCIYVSMKLIQAHPAPSNPIQSIGSDSIPISLSELRYLHQ